MTKPNGVILLMCFALPAWQGCTNTTGQDTQTRTDTDMVTEPQEIARTSKEPREVMHAALTMARGARADQHQALKKLLPTEDLLYRLDTHEDYDDVGGKLRIGAVLEALSENPSPTAREVIFSLTQSPVFIDDTRRARLLIEACIPYRPSPPEVIKFWNNHCRPLDGYCDISIDAMIQNGSEPALELFEKKMLDPQHEDKYKIEWLRNPVFVHRNEAPLLAVCERLLERPLPEPLQVPLVEALFDYQPDTWYMQDYIQEEPPRGKATEEALKILQSIGEYALKKVELPDQLKEQVETVLEEISEKKP